MTVDYDPIKDRLGGIASSNPLLQRLFYALLDLVFLRAWYVKREIRSLLSQLTADRPLRVLDAGTGFGQYAYFIARSFPNAEVLAVDVKKEYLENARRFLDRTPHGPRITLALDDLTKLQSEGPFDLILSVDVMEHIEDDRVVLANFARVLRPGGYVIINTPSNLGGSDVKAEGEPGFIGEHVREGYSAEELEGKLLDAGLEPVRTIYTYGPYGSLAWRFLIKYPMQMLGRTRAAFFFLPFYYAPVLPAGIILNAFDLRRHNEAGTGIIVIARKGPSSVPFR